MRASVKRRAGFTLVELVVVVMIIGILAAIAAPKIFNASQQATQNAARANLRMIRDAIDTYAANNGGSFPPGATLNSPTGPLAQYLRNGVFPNCPIGPNAGTNGVALGTGAPGYAPTPDSSTNPYMYDQTQGWIIINNATYASW